MALPKLNNTPYYDVTIPSTGEKARYRPYLVKEEKVLLMASESESESEIGNAILDVICQCVEGVQRDKITSYDMEYLFLKLRAKAVGESTDILFPCNSCEKDTEVKVKIDDVELDIPKDKNNMIKLSDDMILEVKYPTYNSIINDKILASSESNIEVMYQTAMLCLSALHVKDERMNFADEPIEDIVEFIGGLTTEQFQKLSEFANSIPTVKKKLEWKCKHCEAQNSREVTGLLGFFI